MYIRRIHTSPIRSPTDRSPCHVCRSSSSENKLASIIKRKQRQIQHKLEELGDDLAERLESATETPNPHPHHLTQRIVDIIPTGRPVLVFELGRTPENINTSQKLAEVALKLTNAGADALAVPIDSDDTPDGLADLFAVSRAAPTIPILAKDWFLHPIQVVDAKEAGCSGFIGVVASVTGPRGTPVLSSFSAALGLDCPVEIVNLKELKAMEQYGVPFYAMNISVGLSVAIAGFGRDVADGLLGEMPFGAVSLVGVKSIEDVRKMRIAGADALLVKKELVMGEYSGREEELVQHLLDTVLLDD